MLTHSLINNSNEYLIKTNNSINLNLSTMNYNENFNESLLIKNEYINNTYNSTGLDYLSINYVQTAQNNYAIIYITLLIITCMEILVGNTLLIYTVLSGKLFGNKLTTSYVIMSLSIADLLIGLLIMPYYIIVVQFWSMTDKKTWHYEVWINLEASLTTASIYSLFLVTLDRYLAIKYPIKYTRKISKFKVKLFIALIWILSILTTFLSSILMLILNFLFEDIDQRAFSKKQIEKNVYFHFVLAVLTFYLPFFLILFFNLSTYLIIKKHLKDKNLKIKRLSNFDSNRSSQQMLIDGKVPTTSGCQSIYTTVLSQNDNSNKLCLSCFTNQNYISLISGDQVDYNNNSNLFFKNSFKLNNFKNLLANRRCSLCTCQLTQQVVKDNENSNYSYHFSFTKQNFNSLINSLTWKSFHRNFVEKLYQKQKEGLSKNYSFVSKEFKLIKLLATINLCFIVCWVPYYTYLELVRFNLVTLNYNLFDYLLFLGWLNSGFNTCIYLHLSKKFRKEIKQRLFCFK